jgi:hypothetical protein
MGGDFFVATYFLNLSLFTTSNMPHAVEAFSDLYRHAPPGFCAQICPNPVMRNINRACIYQALSRHQGLITDYKLGRCSTESFLDRLVEVSFPFLNDPFEDYPTDLIDRLWNAREEILSLKDRNYESKTAFQADKKGIALALVEQAWNSFIGFPEEAVLNTKLIFLANLLREGHNVIFISNTNVLNVHKVLNYLLPKLNKLGFNLELNPLIRETQNPSVIDLREHLFLLTSYRFGFSKTGGAMPVVPTGFFATALSYMPFFGRPRSNAPAANTPNILEQGIRSQIAKGEKMENIFVVSQYLDDRTKAANLGILPVNLLDAIPTMVPQQTFRPI